MDRSFSPSTAPPEGTGDSGFQVAGEFTVPVEADVAHSLEADLRKILEGLGIARVSSDSATRAV